MTLPGIGREWQRERGLGRGWGRTRNTGDGRRPAQGGLPLSDGSVRGQSSLQSMRRVIRKLAWCS